MRETGEEMGRWPYHVLRVVHMYWERWKWKQTVACVWHATHVNESYAYAHTKCRVTDQEQCRDKQTVTSSAEVDTGGGPA
jgi:hypothetical protein